MNRERLQHLITVLENVPVERFDLLRWHCGTTACAVGWAAQDPVFNKQGLHLANTHDLVPVFGFSSRWNAVRGFFEIDFDQAEHLFLASEYPAGATPQDVINRIKEMLQ